MNHKKPKSKQTLLIAVTVIAAISVSSVVTGISGQTLQKTFAENNSTTNANAASSSSATTAATIFKTVTPNQSTNKEFWINTVHLDGNTNINAGVKCDTCPQNNPLHPAEQPPANSTIPQGGGFK